MHVQGTVLANSSFRLFATPRGQVGQGFVNALTISETSLKEGGRVPSGVAYDVFAVACQFALTDGINDAGDIDVSLDTAAQINQLLSLQNNGVLSWDFTQTIVEICPVMLAGAGGGAFGAVGTGNGVNVGSMNNGNGQVWIN